MAAAPSVEGVTDVLVRIRVEPLQKNYVRRSIAEKLALGLAEGFCNLRILLEHENVIKNSPFFTSQNVAENYQNLLE